MRDLEALRKALEGPLLEKGYELYSLNVKNEKDGIRLSIVVDRATPISMDDIVEVSSLIDPILDELDPIEGAYTLDVSSLGAEKPIKLTRFPEYIGKYIRIHLINGIKGENFLEGSLIEADGEKIILEINVKGRKKKMEIELSNISEANLAIKF